MTKINKLGKSTFVIAILSFLLVAVLAFGGTYAYFSDSAEVNAKPVTMGTLQLDVSAPEGQESIFVKEGTIAVPNQKIINGETIDIAMTQETNIAYFLRFKIETEVTGATTHNGGTAGAAESENTGDNVGDDHTKILNVTVGGSEGWVTSGDLDDVTEGVQADGYYYLPYDEDGYTKGDDKNITFTVQIHDWVGANGCTAYMGATVNVKVTVEALQAAELPTEGTNAVTDLKSLAKHWNALVGTSYSA